MSFKRDGDDKNALNIQRKRRVADLLYEDIHDGECSKMRNGRYVCKVCPHAPTFDTVNMFHVHKQGKKHLNSLEYQAHKKQEVQDLILKRQQEEEIKSESQPKRAVNDEGSQSSMQLGMKKCMSNPHHRKVTIALGDCKSSTDTTRPATLPGNRAHTGPSLKSTTVRTFNQNAETNKTRKFSDFKSEHSNTTVTVPSEGRKPNMKQVSVKREGRLNMKHEPDHSQDDGPELKSNNLKKFINEGLETGRSSKFYFSRKQQNSTKSTPKTELNLERQHTTVEKHVSLSWERFQLTKGKTFVAPVYQNKAKSETGVTKNQSHITKDQPSISKHVINAINTPGDVANQRPATTSASDKKLRAEQFLNAFGAGWKKDWDGTWIRDEEAEFDSDEEPPNVT